MRHTKNTTDNNPPDKTATENEKLLVQQILSGNSYLSVNKHLLANYEPNFVIWLTNLLDKWMYFQENNMLQEDGSFFLAYEEQKEQIYLSTHQLRQCKNKAIDLGIIVTEKRGIPPKEFYAFDFNELSSFVANCLPKIEEKNNENETH